MPLSFPRGTIVTGNVYSGPVYAIKFLDSASGAVLGTITPPLSGAASSLIGEMARLDSGEWLLSGALGGGGNNLQFLNSDFSSLVAAVSLNQGTSASEPGAVSVPGGSSFFVTNNGGVAAYSGSGVAGSTWTTGNPKRDRLAISPDGTTAYHCENGNSIVYKTVLGGSTSALFNFSGVNGDYLDGGAHRALMCLANGDIVVKAVNGATNGPKLLCYSAAGSLVWSTAMPALSTPSFSWTIDICPGVDDTTFLAVVFDHPNALIKFVDVVASTGAATTRFSVADDGSSGTPIYRNGPYWIMRDATPPTPPPTPPPSTPTPASPTAPNACTNMPQTSSGGIAAGCNPGGVGRAPYTVSSSPRFTAFGKALDHPDPTPNPSLKNQHALKLWVTWHHKVYAADGSSTTMPYSWSTTELAHLSTYYGGRKKARLLRLGSVDHGLGTTGGTFASGAVTVGLSQALAREMLTILGSDSIAGDLLYVYLGTRAWADANTAPVILARSVIETPTTTAPLQTQIQCVDFLFSIIGPLGRPQWPYFSLGDVYVNATSDVKGLPFGPVYGPKTTAGSVDPVTNLVSEKGTLPARLVGTLTLAAGVAAPALPSTIDNSIGEAPSHGILGAADGDWISDGTVTNDPYHAFVRVKNGVIGEWNLGRASTPSPAGTVYSFRDVIYDTASGVADYYFSFQVPADLSAWDPTQPVPSGRTDIRYQIVNATPTNPYSDWTHIAYWPQKDSGSPWGAVTAPTGIVCDMYHVCAGAVWAGGAVYGSDLGGGNPNVTPMRTVLDPSRNGSDYYWPWTPDGDFTSTWPLADPFVDVVGLDGSTYRATVLLAPQNSAVNVDAKSGKVSFAVDLIAGVETQGDGLGLPIVEFHEAQQHWLENYVANRYKTGAYCDATTAPQYPDGVYVFRSSTFKAAQALSTRGPSAPGLPGLGLIMTWAVDSFRSLPQWFLMQNETSNTDLGQNGHFQCTLNAFDQTQTTTTWPRLNETRHVFGDIGGGFELYRGNTQAISCDYDPDAGKFRSGPEVVKNADGILSYQNQEKPRDPLESTLVDNLEQLRYAVKGRLRLFGRGVKEYALPMSPEALDDDVDYPNGGGIRFTSREGSGAAGWVDQPLLIRRRGFDMETFVATLKVWDVGRVLLLGPDFTNVLFASTDSGGPPSTDDTTAEPIPLP